MKSETLELQKQVLALQRSIESLETQESTISSGYLYNQYLAWQAAVSGYLALSGLRGLWPMSAISTTPQALDVSGGGAHLSLENSPLFLTANSSFPAVNLNGSTQSLYAADASTWDIIGNEAYIHSSYRGLTMGAWVAFYGVGQTHGFMGKYTSVAGNRSYLLHVTAANKVRMLVSNDGSNTFYAEWTGTITTGKWYFIVGRYDPSTEVKIWVNEETDSNLISIPATLKNGNADFVLGAYGASGAHTAYMYGAISSAFLCAAMLPDETIEKIYEQTKAQFGY